MLTTAWRDNNGAIFDAPVFAIGDVHGQAQALRHLLDHISSLVSPEEDAELIQLGDLIDRGPDSLGALDLAFGDLPGFRRITHLPGNHELMLLKALRGDPKALSLWLMNGGHAVFDEMDLPPNLSADEQFRHLGHFLPENFEEAYTTGPACVVRHGVLFVHAGLLPGVALEDFMSAPRLGSWSDTHWAWIREPFLNWRGGWEAQGLRLVVHGHTPATSSRLRSPEAAEPILDLAGTKGRICLDAGAAYVDQVAAVEFRGERHRIHVAQAIPAHSPLHPYR
jgi:serine/threonine protein phosphatase 1